MTKLTTITAALGFAACAIVSPHPVQADRGPGCVHRWFQAIVAPQDAMQAEMRKLHAQNFADWNTIDFIAYQCQMDGTLTKLLVCEDASRYSNGKYTC